MSKPLVQRYNGLENLKGRSRTNMTSTLLNDTVNENMGSVISFENIPISKITPRSINQYSQTRIDRLARSIRATNNRLINPITVVRASDLPQDGDVITKFRETGVDVEALEYVIVAGERRFRAFKQLQAEEEAKGIDIGDLNPFDTITANVLTSKEAKNEHIFYEQSNTESRQLGPEEVMRLFESALKEVDTDEKKRNMLFQMRDNGVDIKKDIPDDDKEAARMFRKDTYCVYYLETELGISGWSEGTARRYISIINLCCDEVKQAIYDCVYPIREAKNITKYPFETQRNFLNLWISDKKDEYDTLLKNDGKEVKPKIKHYTHKTAGKKLESILAQMEKEKKNLSEFEKNLGGEDKALIKQAMQELEKCDAKIRNIIELLK